MQFKIFSIPMQGDEMMMEEMNHFLRANKIIEVRKEFSDRNGSWTFCITYLDNVKSHNMQSANNQDNKEKVDYRKVLDEATFQRFALMRKIRKQIADSEGIPAFAVFTDAELSQIAKLENPTESAIKSIGGIGQRHAEKYAKFFVVDNTLEDCNETSDKSL